MSEIIEKTYELLDTLDNSDLIKNLTKYKNNLLKNESLLADIKNIKELTDNKSIIEKRISIFGNTDYKLYMKYYNELSLIILKINQKFKSYTSTREHNC